MKEERAKSNLLLSRSLNSDEKAKRRLEDISITAISTSLIRDNSMGSNLLPFEYSLSQNYPNPFNPSTKINFDLPVDGKANLVIYDMLGREIMKLVNNELKTAGRYTIEFNGVNFASGVYFYRLEVNNFVQTKRMVLLK
ncbi:MAG: T9SS type A sorting domain-containing protein [Ignavibacteria bacterium]|nr:T9SS type A sorting domain-containing protein [Ignavibacteria bacterium]